MMRTPMMRTTSICLMAIGIAGIAHALAPEHQTTAPRGESTAKVLAHAMQPVEDLDCRLEATAAQPQRSASRLAELVTQHRAVSRLSLSQDSLISAHPTPAQEQPGQGHCG